MLGSVLLSGAVVGVSLGLIGGGGSVLAVPLLVYFVGVGDPHMAIGTSSVAVAANALANLYVYARQGAVKWRCASVFTLMGVVGAHLGAEGAQAMDGKRLLALFGGAMVLVGLTMLRRHDNGGDPGVRLSRKTIFPLLPALLAMGLGVGLLSGFFGIGGGVLIVPSLVFATGMPLLNAIATSLVAVTAFGLTTALTYAGGGNIDWVLAAQFLGAGLVGSVLGRAAGRRLAAERTALKTVFSIIVMSVGAYVIARGMLA